MQNLIIALGVTVLGIFIYYALDLVPRVKRENLMLREQNKLLKDMLEMSTKETGQWRDRYIDEVTPGPIDFKDRDNDREK